MNKISNIFGNGDSVYGLNDGLEPLSAGETPKPYTTAITLSATPTGWRIPSYPTWALNNTGYGSKFCHDRKIIMFEELTDFGIASIPIPVYTPAPLWKPEGDYDKHYWGSF